jgi:hypothetical protein
MRARKTSSNDRTGERCKYLSGIPENQRVKGDIQIIRNGTLPGGSHRDVKLIENGVVIFHGKQ